MPDSNFYKKNGNFKLGYLAEISASKLLNPEHSNILIKDVASLDSAKEGDIGFLQNPKYIEKFKHTKATACIISEKNIHYAPQGISLLISENPYYSFAVISQKFYLKENKFLEISEHAIVDHSAEVGARSVIHSGAFIGAGVKIGKNCIIHPNVSITNTIIGDNVIIHHGAAIGQDGFGYAFNNGRHHKIPQLGRVIIGNDVEIGANTCIDRGAGPDTVIGEGTKIDNLVQIGHNVKVGKHCIIVSQVGISGSTEIGDYTIIGGQVGIIGHLKIGKAVQIAAQSGVFKDLEDKAIVGGSPSVPLRQYHKQAVILDRLVNKKQES